MSEPASFTNKLALGEAPRGEAKRRVIVTGGSGKLGRATVRYLADEGWEVISVDTRRPQGISEDGKSGLGGAYRLVEVDLEDMGSVLETFMSTDMAYSGIQAVVHLAAIPSPGQTSASRQFRTNTMSTYNVLEACRKIGIKNVVLASSETLIGIPFDPHMPESLPITEEHERKPESAYSLSKLMGETMAEQYTRWDPELKVISLRFSNVMLPQEYASFESWQDDPKARYWNCWGYIDARDGAQSVSLSLDSKRTGHHQYLIAAEDTCMRKSNDELVKAVFPNVKYNPTANSNDTLLSIEKAKKELGFKPAYKWQEQIGNHSKSCTIPPLSPETIAAITKSVADGFDDQIAYTQKLIRFGGQRGEEVKVQDFVFEQYEKRGWAPERIDIDENELSKHIGAGKFSPTHSKAPIVVGKHKQKGEAKGKSLVLNGHLDVVPTGPTDMWAADPYSGKIEGDKLYGRGAGDMRAGAAANVWALDALKRIGLQPASEVILQAVVEEESTGNGTLMAHVKGYKADAALIPEPMQEQLVRANVGVLWFQIEVRGRPVHVRAMATGSNAIDSCWKVVGSLRELEQEWNDRHAKDRFFENEKHPLNLNVAIVKAGDWASSVPAWCRMDCRIAIVPGVTAKSAADEIEKKVADFSAADPFLRENPPKITWNGFFSEGYAENILRKAHQQATGEELTTQTSTAYIDARVHSLYDKIPAMVYGPIAGDIHGFDEWVSIESVKRITTAMALFIAEWCGLEEI